MNAVGNQLFAVNHDIIFNFLNFSLNLSKSFINLTNCITRRIAALWKSVIGPLNAFQKILRDARILRAACDNGRKVGSVRNKLCFQKFLLVQFAEILLRAKTDKIADALRIPNAVHRRIEIDPR